MLSGAIDKYLAIRRAAGYELNVDFTDAAGFVRLFHLRHFEISLYPSRSLSLPRRVV
jgi:hypothetical protein